MKKSRDEIMQLIKNEISLRASDGAIFTLNKGFMELGLDSIELMDLGLAIEEALGIEIEPELLFEYSTVDALSDHLYGLLNPEAPKAQQSGREACHQLQEHDVAIIGLGCRFPGGIDNPSMLWDSLKNGEDALAKPVTHRKAYREPLGGFLEEIEQFDAEFFGISPREAIYIDPQQRLLLEVIWDALKQADINPQALKGSPTGVYVGISNNDYRHSLSRSSLPPSLFLSTGNSPSVASGRISYLLGLTGPSMSIDTACSSSLVAVHLACQAIKNGECQLALVAGVNVILEPSHTNNLMAAGMLSPEGRCKSFDVSANGFVRSEGCGLVILAPWDSEFAKNPLAIIKGSAVNQDGLSSGLSAPNIQAQQDVINTALSHAGINAADVDYIEAHGSATPIGDTIELNALKRCYTPREHPLNIGSIKATIGHAESASGIAGLIKTVLLLMHEQIPAQLHFHKRNKNTKLTEQEATIPTKQKPWPRSTRKRMAGVSSFGFSGTNCHLIVAESPQKNILKPYQGNKYARQYYWPTTEGQNTNDLSIQPLNHPLLNNKIECAHGEVLYTGHCSLKKLPYLKSHDIFGHILFPGAAFLELFMKIASIEFQKDAFSLEHFSVSQALIIKQDDEIELQVLSKKNKNHIEATVYARKSKENRWTNYAHAILLSNVEVLDKTPKQIQAKGKAHDAERFYETMNANGIHYGKEFQVLNCLHISGQELSANLVSKAGKSNFSVHPTVLDGCFQSAMAWAFLNGQMKKDEAYLPVAINKVTVYSLCPEQISVFAKIQSKNTQETMLCELSIYDKQGTLVLFIEGLTGKGATLKAISQQLSKTHSPTSNKTDHIESDLNFILSNTPKKRQTKVIKDFVRAQVAFVLKKDLDQVDMSAGFFDMGMDSLMLMEVQERIQKALGESFELSSTASFDFPSPDALSMKLVNELMGLKKQPVHVDKIKIRAKEKSVFAELSIEELIKKIDED